MKNNTEYSLKGDAFGLLGGMLWGIDTVLIGIVLAMSPLKNYVIIAPLVATFLHDFCSTIWLLIYTGFQKNLKLFFSSFKTRGAYVVMLAAIFGGPLGMTGYVQAIHYIGAGNTAIISAAYPAFGALLGRIFLKERLNRLGIFGLTLTVAATIVLGTVSGGGNQNSMIGFAFAIMCVVGWGSESVISSFGMREMLPDIALQIRQMTSAIVYLVVILPLFKGYRLVLNTLMNQPTILLIAITALAGSISYLMYYRSIKYIGPTIAMGLNISFSAWTVVFGFFAGSDFSILKIVIAIIIILGCVLTAGKPQDFMEQISKFKRE
ncbi:DMT family transporter [Pediococcus argentinicus]|uniref:Integral membrane protein domain protein n=1 Tax=Pediococcus argentinicus TaxID=480391 RepID=A0A0R2NE04_9LACO|nr:DMT family transporter [Pediococcus argentinicus]KRO24069.1 integral membrane protein domain protein [Pediococcus argentinicus]NKZ22525.1 DMT family transporter [Pediococcus argentinicus]GEP19873.1 choline transporter [Pediococcus argentinicus]